MIPILTILAMSDVYNPLGYGRLRTFTKSYDQTFDQTFDRTFDQNFDQSFNQKNYVTMLSGDFISPSKYTSIDNGETLLTAISKAGIDYVSFGNHEFDIPIDTLNEQLAKLNTKNQFHHQNKPIFISSNVFGLYNTVPYDILSIGNFSIGIIGVCTDKMYYVNHPHIIDPIEATKNTIKIMPVCDMYVAMTHQEIEEDIELANKVPDLDLILGGHIHDMSIISVNHYDDNHNNFKSIPIIRTGEDLMRVAAIDIHSKNTFDVQIISLEHYDIDEEIANYVKLADKNYTDYIDNVMGKEIVYELKPGTTLNSYNMRSVQSNIGYFVCDQIALYFKADLCLINGGFFRVKRIYENVLTRKDIFELFPINDPFVVVNMTGESWLAAIKYSHIQDSTYGGFLHHNNLNFTIDDTTTYSVALSSVLLFGIDNNPILMNVQHSHAHGDGILITSILKKH